MNLTARIGQHWQQCRDLLNSEIPWSVRLATFNFRRKRGDYYQYLADLLQGTGGRFLITDVFEADAYRYGRSSRGVLSAYWLSAFARNAGSLAHTFAGTLPREDVLMIRILEERGGPDVLEEGLKEMATNVQLSQKAMGMFYGALGRIGLPLLILIGMFVMIPNFTVPELKANASMVPPANYPAAAKELFALSDFLSGHAFAVVAALMAVFGVIIASLSRLRGPLRPFFDKYLLVWGIYRDFQAIKFLTALSLILKKRNDESGRLDSALSLLRRGASPWLSYQIDAMRQGIYDNYDDQDVFDVGILDRDMTFYLQDLIVSRNIDDALMLIRPRLETGLLKTMTKRATWVSTVLLIATSFVGLYIYQLHSEAAMGLQQVMFGKMR